jgi:sodium/bile acid cotransporter 7
VKSQATFKSFLIRRWFLLALALVLWLGIYHSEALLPLTTLPRLRQVIVVAVMFLMALPLRAVAIQRTISRPVAPLLASTINYTFVPLLAWVACLSLGLWDGFNEDMGFGILVACTTPCTLASAAVWTRRAGGNDAAAIMVTIFTNLLCFLITPAWLSLMIGRIPEFDPLSMVSKLGLLIVLPMLAAQAIRLIRPVGTWATENKTGIGVLAQCGVLTMIFWGAIQTGTRLRDGMFANVGLNVLMMLIVVLSIHFGTLLAAMRMARWMGLSRREEIAVGFSGSQKTCMVGLEVAAQIGVTMLPMVSYHVGQLLIDTVIADRLRKQDEENTKP